MTDTVEKRFTLIWQSRTPHEQDWIDEVFGPYVKEQIYDGEHKVVRDEAILCDAFILTTPVEYYEAFQGRRSFLVNFLDENYDGGYERYAPFLGVFRKHWARLFEADARLHRFPLGYSNGFAAPDGPPVPASRRPYLWSFVGAGDKSSRPEALRSLRDLQPHFVMITDDFRVPGTDYQAGRMAPVESAHVLQQSTFAPAPMGNVNLECFRIYEALEAGAIPLIEERGSLRYFDALLGPHPLPAFQSWKAATRFVGDLRASPERLDALQTECLQWWRTYKAQFSAEVGGFMASRLRTAADGLQPLSLSHSRRWQVVELLKHQTPAALGRRVRRQVTRFMKTGRVRMAHGH